MDHLKPRFKIPLVLPLSTLFFVNLLISNTIHADDAAFMSNLATALGLSYFWSPNTSFCKWEGVRCDNSNRVTSINLTSKSLRGTLPSGLNSLSHLKFLSIQHNAFSGPLPSLANLTLLQQAYLNHNNFTSIQNGTFQGLPNLHTLTLSYNTKLKPWTFPIDLTNSSSSLNTLDLVATNLMGPLPDIFDSFPNLQTLLLSHNSITGFLPESFARSKVVTLWLDHQLSNKVRSLSGTIEVLSSMNNLSQAWLHNNYFQGTIPDLSNCNNLVDLQLKDNELMGVVPYSLMNLSSLRNISLGNNLLQGPFPAFGKSVNVSIGGKEDGNGFCMDHPGPCDQKVTTLLEIAAAFGYPMVLANMWQGNDPCEDWEFITCHASKIKAVDLGKRNLSGRISRSFGDLTDLWMLDLSNNRLQGSIPEILTSLTQLEILDLSNNNLSGEVPKFPPRVKLNITGNSFLVPNSDASASPFLSASGWISGVFGAGVVMFIVIIILNRKGRQSLMKRRIFKKTRPFLDHNVRDFMKKYKYFAPRRYSYLEVKKMTNSFQHKLGQGGFGVVYKASLSDGDYVAVKVINESKGSGEEFINEVASISKTSHVNIVSLLGFCYEGNKRVLIYEFMSNGSLDKFIYKRGAPNATCNLDWNILYKIAIGIAQGLAYLHQGCSTRIIHLDIKPQNILLDEDFCPKISDFGLAKLCKKKESIVSLLGMRGTIGYIAPEVLSRIYGGVSHKSDIYSYGMLILEMVGGRKYCDNKGSSSSEMFFPDWIYRDLEQGNTTTRSSLTSQKENEMVKKMTMVSLWCIQILPAERPSINKVVEMLEGPLELIPFPPKPTWYVPNIPPLQYSDLSFSSSSSMYEPNSTTS